MTKYISFILLSFFSIYVFAKDNILCAAIPNNVKNDDVEHITFVGSSTFEIYKHPNQWGGIEINRGCLSVIADTTPGASIAEEANKHNFEFLGQNATTIFNSNPTDADNIYNSSAPANLNFAVEAPIKLTTHDEKTYKCYHLIVGKQGKTVWYLHPNISNTNSNIFKIKCTQTNDPSDTPVFFSVTTSADVNSIFIKRQ